MDSAPVEKGTVVLLRCAEPHLPSTLLLRQVDEYMASFKTGSSKTSPLVIGNYCSDLSERENLHSLSQFYLGLYRQHGMSANTREVVLSTEDQLAVLQLCLAERNKQERGDFDVDVSLVLEKSNAFIRSRLGEENIQPDTELHTDYDNFLKHNNTTDFIHVFNKIKAKCGQDEELKASLRSKDLVLSAMPSNKVEQEMLRYLCAEKRLVFAAGEAPLERDHAEGEEKDEDLKLHFTETSWEEMVSTLACGFDGTKSVSVSEAYVHKVLMSYLHLLLNSRCELAMARIINIPDRGLDHAAFTKLKRYAKEKNMPIFQIAASFIMRLRLGGKSYAPDPHCVLAQHCKGIGLFVDLMHKLQTVIEEVSNTSLALKKVLNFLKSTILKGSGSTIRPSAVSSVVDGMLEQAQEALAIVEKQGNSPKRSASDGGSMLGWKALKVIREMLDHAATMPTNHSNIDMLTDSFSSQKTPIRFPCLFSQFRSPEEVEESPEDKTSQSLASRVLGNLTQNKKIVVVPRYKATMDWALPSNYVNTPHKRELEEICTVTENIQRSTIVQAGDPSKGQSVTNKVLESIRDQENVSTVTSGAKTTAATTTNISRKRPLETENTKEQNKKSKQTKTKATRRKLIPQVKGQKSLTNFFRI